MVPIWTEANNMSRAFCFNCGEYVEYMIRGRDVDIITPKGKKFKCRELYAMCMKCANEIYVPKINDENVKLREIAYNNMLNGYVR